MQIAEYVGLTQEAITLVEQMRQSSAESRSDILIRALSSLKPQRPENSGDFLDLGQGARLYIGERPVLFLSEETKRRNQPDAIAEVRAGGFYLDGKKIEPSKGSVLQPAMKLIQERKGHRNAKGEIISLSAWRQWHIIRDGKLLSILELKDPTLAHKRGREITLEDLGL